jgi:hypothetical protein
MNLDRFHRGALAAHESICIAAGVDQSQVNSTVASGYGYGAGPGIFYHYLRAGRAGLACSKAQGGAQEQGDNCTAHKVSSPYPNR